MRPCLKDRNAKPVKLFIAVIFSQEQFLDKATKELRAKFGNLDFESEALDFNYTRYYEKEFGPCLRRKFLSFSNLICPIEIAAIKTITNRIELALSKDKKRRVNLDPGYLNDAKLILATTKDYSHRIYLSKGIYAEVTLSFSQGSFKPYPWAYPDYQTKEYTAIFNHIRNIFMQQRKNA